MEIQIAIVSLLLTVILYALNFLVYLHPKFRRSPYHSVLYMHGKKPDMHHPSVFAFVVSLHYPVALLITIVASYLTCAHLNIKWSKLGIAAGVCYVIVFTINDMYAKKVFGFPVFSSLNLRLFIKECKKEFSDKTKYPN
ncbi:MAG: hypothetical protein JNL74_03365 [Fibrobacteres bacterium]|nr:hypothetical protein [Fibrobacterota bacterium]